MGPVNVLTLQSYHVYESKKYVVHFDVKFSKPVKDAFRMLSGA
jgi:hypothetical protein